MCFCYRCPQGTRDFKFRHHYIVFRVKLVCKNIFLTFCSPFFVLVLLFSQVSALALYPFVSLTAVSTVVSIRVASLMKPSLRLTLTPGHLVVAFRALRDASPTAVILGSEGGLPFTCAHRFVCLSSSFVLRSV